MLCTYQYRVTRPTY